MTRRLEQLLVKHERNCSQKQYARVILNVKNKREVSTVTLFHKLGWLPIDVRIHYFTAVAMFNIMNVNGQAPVDLVNMFTQNNSVHDHNTPSGTNIRVKKCNLSIGQRTFAYRGAKVWDTCVRVCVCMYVCTYSVHYIGVCMRIYTCIYFFI